MSKQSIYLDYAAATPVDPDVLARMQPFFTGNFYNPSAQYLAAKSVRATIDEARQRVARALGARSGEVVFTAGATEANNMAVHGVMSQFPNGKVLYSAIEHDSVLKPARQYNHAEIPVNAQGMIVKLKELKKMLSDDVVLVSIVYANNEIGTIQQLSKIAEVIRKVRAQRIAAGNKTPLYFHTDAAQAPNYCHVLPKRLGVDLMSLNGGKIYGPKQSGCLYVRAGVTLEPLISGGGQEHGLRSGTENVANIVGFSHALEAAVAKQPKARVDMWNLKLYFLQQIEKELSGKAYTNAAAQGLMNILHMTVPDQDNERLMMALDEAGIMVATGSACSASDEEASHVLKAIGLSDETARSSLRFSMGRTTTEADIDNTVKTLAQILSK